jgi:putative ABC transport system ATP-binding protein
VSAVESLWQEPDRAPEQIEWPALVFHDVFKIYRSGSTETVALRGLELSVDRGEIVAILGPSGCGKSTLLALAAALDQPSAGEVRAGEQSLGRLAPSELADYRAREMAIVFQSDNLWSALSASENVMLSLRLAGVRDANAACARALAMVGLEQRARHRAGALSGGEQQRVAIAAAAAREAPLVLADEPTGELDAANERIVLEGFRRVRAELGTTIVIVTHSAAVAAAADRVVEMRDGAVLR